MDLSPGIRADPLKAALCDDIIENIGGRAFVMLCDNYCAAQMQYGFVILAFGA